VSKEKKLNPDKHTRGNGNWKPKKQKSKITYSKKTPDEIKTVRKRLLAVDCSE